MPPIQNYENHRYNPKPTVIGMAFALIALLCFAGGWLGFRTTGLGQLFLTLAVLVLFGISRLYTTTLQDRIIRLEMWRRCDRILSPTERPLLDRLTRPQLIALRFTSDEELPALLDRALNESLTPDQIKRAVKNWVPDYHRT